MKGRGWFWLSWGCAVFMLALEAADQIRAEERARLLPELIVVQPVPLADEAGVWLQGQQPDGG